MAKATIEQTSNIAQRRRQALKSGDDDYQQRRANLLQAAVKVFQEKGYKGASLNAIAQAVGIDRASLYYYTSGKEELFREAVRDATLSNVLMAEELHRSDAPSRKKLEDFIVGLMRSYQVHYPYLFIYVQEDMTQIAGTKSEWAGEMRRLTLRFTRAVIGMVQDGMDDGTFRREVGSAKLIAFGIIGMCNWSHRWYKPDGPVSAEDIGRIYAETVLGGLLLGPGARKGRRSSGGRSAPA